MEQELRDGDEEGELTVWLTGDRRAERYFWNVRVGHLDPVEELPGVRQRLRNLGFYCGESESAEIDDLTRHALRGFQESAGLEKSGAIDDATRAKLVELHGDV